MWAAVGRAAVGCHPPYVLLEHGSSSRGRFRLRLGRRSLACSGTLGRRGRQAAGGCHPPYCLLMEGVAHYLTDVLCSLEQPGEKRARVGADEAKAEPDGEDLLHGGEVVRVG